MDDAVTHTMPERVWRPRAQAHTERADALVADHLQRRAQGLSHPVHDFMFTYYRYRPAQLRRWHPGYGTHLAGGADEYRGLRGYRATSDGGARVGQDYLTRSEERRVGKGRGSRGATSAQLVEQA